MGAKINALAASRCSLGQDCTVQGRTLQWLRAAKQGYLDSLKLPYRKGLGSEKEGSKFQAPQSWQAYFPRCCFGMGFLLVED